MSDDNLYVVNLKEAKYLMIVYGQLYTNKTDKQREDGVIRAVQIKKACFILDTFKNRYKGNYGDYIVQIEDTFRVMTKEEVYSNFIK